MKKLMVVGMAAVFAAGFASAQDDVVMVGQAPSSDRNEALATAEIALVSADVWRGMVRNEDFVVQPQFSISQYGVSFNIWGNYDFSKNYLGVENNLSEIDMSLAYTLPVDLNDVSFDVGIVSYQHPANGGGIPGPLGINRESTMELFASAYWLTFKDFLIPSVTFFGDVKEADGVYIDFDVVAPIQISEYLAVEAGINTGWGNGSWNKYYYLTGGKGFVDYNIYGTVSYEILDGLTAAFNLTYTGLYGGGRKDNAKIIYEAGEKFWGGFNIAYDF